MGEKQLKNVKIVYPRAESGGGGAHWLLRPHGGIICVYSLGRGKGRLGVILARRHSHLSQYRAHSSFQLLNTFRPPRSPPKSSRHHKDLDPAGELGNCPYPQALGTGGYHQQHSKGTKLVHAIVGSLGGNLESSA